MKKIKLLTSLSTIGVLGGGVAVAATSCSNGGEDTKGIKAVANTNCTISGNEVSITDITYAAKITLSIAGVTDPKF